ncbi:MAG: O-antigen ligase domain-containing protein, partial [Bacteroidales bacterium]
DFVDELLIYFLLSFTVLVALLQKRVRDLKGLLILLSIFIFYLIYSITITKINTPNAAFNDFIIQLKPFIAFFCVYVLKPQFTVKEKKLLRYICVSLAALMLIIFIIPGDLWESVFFHRAYLGISATILSMIYYYCSPGDKRSKIYTLLILSVGLLGMRSKFYGFFVMAIFMLFFFQPDMFKRIRLKHIIMAVVVLIGILFVAWEKISFYFITNDDITTKEFTESAARAALYAKSPEIIADYFPFGSGLGTYATYSSGLYYSPLYEKYDLSDVWGLVRGEGSFISDTFYPELAQFGIFGIILYILFIRYIFLKIKNSVNILQDKNIHIAILMLSFVLIESVAGSVFLQGGGAMAMMLLALSLNDSMKNTAVS